MSPPAIPAPTSPVTVLGATSLIGRFLVGRLEGAGVEAFAVSRRPPARKPGGRVAWTAADLNAPGLQALLPQAETVISLSPIWLLPGALPALQARGMRRLVAFSSTSVFTKAGSENPAERSVARDLANGEAAARLFCETNGVAWTLLRPTLIYAEGRDHNVTRLAGLVRRLGVLPLAGRGEGLRQPVHADDLARAALDAAASPAAAGKAYELAGGETLTYRQMAERVFQALGRKPRIIAAPSWLWRLAFGLAGPLLPGATAQMGRRMSADLVFNDAPARQDFGWNPRVFQPDFCTKS